MRNVLHRVYGDGVCLNRIDFGSCWPFMDGWQETDFRIYMANTLRDSLFFRLCVWTNNPPPSRIHTKTQKCAHMSTHMHIRNIKLSDSICVCLRCSTVAFNP